MMNSSKNVAIDRIINFLKSDDSQPKESKIRTRESIKTLRQCATEIGLSHEQIYSIADIASSNKFGELDCNGLIHSLLPRDGVSEDTMLMIVSKICADVQSLKIKSLLLRWMILVFDMVSNKARYHSIYGMLFRYIHNDTLCPFLCHLLYLLTRKCDVTHYRIAKLLELQRQVGSQPHISGLLSLYRIYHPALISMSGLYKRFFKPDKVWEKSIATVQQRYGLNLLSEGLSQETDNFSKSGMKKQTLMQKPSFSMVHDSSAVEQPFSSIISGKIPIHQIKSFQELLNHIGQLELSSQAFTMLSSNVLQHVMAMTPDRTVALRLSFWLHHWLNIEVLSNCGETEKGKELMTTTLQFSSLIQECLPVCEEFLYRYLYTWNGSDYRKSILNMISKLRIMPFPELRHKILIPLKKLYTLSLHVYFKCSIISTLTDLLSNYLTVESNRYTMMNQSEEEVERASYTHYPHSGGAVDVDSTISELVHFVDELYSESVISDYKSTLLLYYVLQFHHQVSTMYLRYRKPLLLLPSRQVLFYSTFSLSSPCLAMITKILYNHLQSMAYMKEKEISVHGFKKTTLLLNRYCVDVFDLIWRRRSFHPLCQKDTIVFPDEEAALLEPFLSHPDELPPSRMFSIDRHPALLANIEEFLRISNRNFSDTEMAEFVLESSFMEFLESNGLKDINNFVTVLQGK